MGEGAAYICPVSIATVALGLEFLTVTPNYLWTQPAVGCRAVLRQSCVRQRVQRWCWRQDGAPRGAIGFLLPWQFSFFYSWSEWAGPSVLSIQLQRNTLAESSESNRALKTAAVADPQPRRHEKRIFFTFMQFITDSSAFINTAAQMRGGNEGGNLPWRNSEPLFFYWCTLMEHWETKAERNTHPGYCHHLRGIKCWAAVFLSSSTN